MHAGVENLARRAISVPEVLVVIGVIAMLAAIAAPALSSARMSARSMLCQSNLRQMAVAAHAYSNIYSAFPPAVHYEKSDGILKDVSWDWVTRFGSGELLSPGPLWQFTNNPHQVMQCPAYFGTSNTPGDPYTGFNYSVYLGGEAKFSINPGPQHVWPGAKPHAVRQPSEIAMFGCGGLRGGTNKYMRSPAHNAHAPIHPQHGPFTLNLTTIYSGGQGFRYRGSTYVAYVDASVRAVHGPAKGDSATDALLAQLGYPRNGFLSDDGSAYDPLK